MTLSNTLVLPKMNGAEVSPGIFLMGEPTPIPGTNKLRCLADVCGALAIVELTLKFSANAEHAGPEGRK